MSTGGRALILYSVASNGGPRFNSLFGGNVTGQQVVFAGKLERTGISLSLGLVSWSSIQSDWLTRDTPPKTSDFPMQLIEEEQAEWYTRSSIC